MNDTRDTHDPGFVTAVTSEYWALQSARSGTVFESAGRITGYLGTLSSFVVALAFIGQVSKVGRPFFLFSFLLLPTLFFIGVMTYGRVLQNGLEDLLVTRGMARIRRALVNLAPDAEPYFVLSTHDDVGGHMRSMALDPRKRQLMFTGASAVALLNSVVAGVFGGLVASATLSVSIEASAAAGAVTGLLVAMVFIRHEVVQWRRAETNLPPLFPSPDSNESKELV
jgi:hypothetical protein